MLLVVVPAFGALAARRSRVQLMVSVQTFFIGCLVAFLCAGARAGPRQGIAFYLWVGVFNVLVISNFWSFATDLFTQEQGKRLFGIIGLGGSAGAIVGALVPGFLKGHADVYELMLVAGGGLAVSTAIYAFVDRTPGTPAKTPEQMDRKGGFAMVATDRYLRLIAIMLVLATVVNTTGEYVVGSLVEDASRSVADREAYIASFYSSYYGAVNVVSALIQGLVVARLLSGLGVRRTLFVMPMVALASWLVFFARSTVAMIRVTKTAENSFDYSLHNTVRQALFLPTSRDAKYKAKAAIDTFVFRLADVVAGVGVVYILVHLGIGMHGFAIVNLALTLAWLVVVARTGRMHDALATTTTKS